jgi:hypothetical protein
MRGVYDVVLMLPNVVTILLRRLGHLHVLINTLRACSSVVERFAVGSIPIRSTISKS